MENSAGSKITGHIIDDIVTFQKHYGFDAVDVKYSFLVNQVQFLAEELNETISALSNDNAEEFLDGIIDILVVAAGTALFCTERPDHVIDAWKKVMSANLSKKVGVNPKRPNANGVDLIKPEGWTPPDLREEAQYLQKIFDSTPLGDRPEI